MTNRSQSTIGSLFGPVKGPCPVEWVNPVLARDHYLGPINRGFAWADEFGVLVLANPSARFLPQQRWLELVRWCLVGEKNGGSRQWARVSRWLRKDRPDVTTVVSYSDPSVGHTGALYKACNWRWAPTWHRLRPPPLGQRRVGRHQAAGGQGPLDIRSTTRSRARGDSSRLGTAAPPIVAR
jgi:hypothetical protein